MKQKTTFSLWKRLLLLLILFVPLVQSYGQARVDAKLGEYDKTDLGILGGSKPVVENPENVNKFDNNHARLVASPGQAVDLGAYTSFIELVFPKTLEANQTSYVRLQPDGRLLEGLLGGSLGELLSGVLGAVLTGNQEFDITVGLGQQPVLFGSSTLAFKTDVGTINVVKDKDNYYYLAITPTKKYDRIKLQNKTGGLLGLGVIKKLDVFHAFTYDETGADCGKPIFTSFDGSGLDLDVLAAKDPKLNYAIDSDKSTYSTLNKGSLLSVKVGGSMSQIFYFPTTSDEKATVNIRLAVGSTGVLDLNLLGGVEVLAYHGKSTAPVYQKSLSGGLITDLNLLNLIKSGKAVDITVAPGKAFDRLEVRLKAPVGVDLLGSSVRIYDVERFDGTTCKNPLVAIPEATEQPFDVALCSTSLEDFKNVDFPFNAVDGNNETYTTLTAFNGNLLVSGPQSGSIHMKYDKAVPANKTSYIRIDADKDMLNALLGGTLGKLVADLGGLLLGNHIFKVEAYNAAGTSVLKSSSSNQFEGTANGVVKLVQDNIGRYYLAVTPSQAYQSIVVSNSVSSLLPTGENRTLKVYNMCTDIGTDLCFPAQFTSYDQKGISLSVSDLGKAGVKNPYHAISGNSSNYSEISNGLLSVGGLVKQTVYFNQPSQVGDELKVRLQLDPSSLLSLDLLGGYKIVTSLGGEEQESFTLQQGLINSLNLLDLFKSGGVQTLSFDTRKVFDRVDIQVTTVLSVSVTPSIRLYDVKRVSSTCPETTTVSPFIKPVCATTVISASNVDDIDNIFSDNFDAYATINSGAGLLLGLGDKYSGHIELGYEKEVAANTTSYVRFDFDEKLLNALLGGSLGNVVNGLVNGLVLGDHFFEVEVKNAAEKVILDGKSNVSNNSAKGAGTIRVVTDKLGRTYLAITPTVPYKSVRLTDKTNSQLGLLAKPNTMNVYSMCYESDTNSCVPSFATSYEYSGLALDVKDLSGAGVKYPERAIDDNTTSYSEISSGTLNIAGAVRQYIYFNSDAKAGEETLIKFKTQGGQVNVDLIGALEIKAYKGEKEVDALSSANGLINGINVLDLLTNNQMVELPFRPKAAYDRISIGMKSLVGVSVGASLHLYDVARTCRIVNPNQSLVSWKSYKVNNDATINAVKGGEVVEYTIHVRNEGTTPIADFIVKDKMPEGVSYESSVEGTYNNGEVIFSHKGSLAPGATTTFTFKVNVNASLKGIVEIKNIAYVGEAGQEVGKEVFYPSYPPIDNANPTQPDGTKAPGTVIKVTSDSTLDKPTIVSVDDEGVESLNNEICKGTSITLKVKEEGDTYQWYFNGNAITPSSQENEDNTDNPNLGTERTLETETPGNYTVIITKDKAISKRSDVFEVIEKDGPTIAIDGSQRVTVKLDDSGKAILQLPKVQTNGNGIYWLDQNNKLVQGNQVEFNASGNYTLTVFSELNGCEGYENLLVTVLDDSLCPPTLERVYARGGKAADGTDMNTTWYTTLAGFVANKEKAVDGDPTTHSTISTTVALLGLGTTWQNIYFDHPVKAGTPVTIKLGKEYSGLVVAGGMSVVGLTKSGKRIGTIKPVAGGLLDLLTGDNVVEYTFVPSDKNGPQEYYGVQISLGALVGVAQLAKIYGVYYDKPVASFPQGYCEPVSNGVHPSVLDVLHGVQDLGLGVASATASVVNPWNAVDNDPNSHATISRGVAVLNAATLTVVFKQQAMPGDELHIVTEVPGNPILSLELIKGYTIQRYLGDKKVGPELDGTNGVKFLDLKLLGLGYKNKYKMIIKETNEPFDRVKISYGNVVGVLGNFTKIYEVSVAPKMDLGNGFDVNEDTKEVCEQGDLIILAIDTCTEYQMFTNERQLDPNKPDQPIVGKVDIVTNEKNVSVNQFTFRLPKDLEQHEELDDKGYGTGEFYKVVYIQTFRNGCPVGRRIPIKLDTRNCSVKTNLNITTKIK
ncbi:DUF11 domain-containing protein [Myroides albus]|uniref:DUF11 domain-containing protein n=1 Tax=Myroides albus TaxID=2562892 RepID=UPI002158A9CA|nr:DUF11 domain-containing protein [Myroides albus]UVD79287.1 DUF11 domain-containing protein [Myroides albus]